MGGHQINASACTTVQRMRCRLVLLMSLHPQAVSFLPLQVFSIEFNMSRSEKFPVICFLRKASNESIPNLCRLCSQNDAEAFAHELGVAFQVETKLGS